MKKGERLYYVPLFIWREGSVLNSVFEGKMELNPQNDEIHIQGTATTQTGVTPINTVIRKSDISWPCKKVWNVVVKNLFP